MTTPNQSLGYFPNQKFGWKVDGSGNLVCYSRDGEVAFTVAPDGTVTGGASALWGQSSTAKFSGSGSPVGVVTPTGEGDLYVDATTPALWQANGVTSADWAVVGGGGSQPFAAATNSGAQTGVTNGGTLTFDTIIADADSFFNGTDTFTVPAGKGGVYLIVSTASEVVGEGAADPGPFVEIQINSSPTNQGGTLAPLAVVPNGYFDGNTVLVVPLADGDTVVLKTNWTGIAASVAVTTAALALSRLG